MLICAENEFLCRVYVEIEIEIEIVIVIGRGLVESGLREARRTRSPIASMRSVR